MTTPTSITAALAAIPDTIKDCSGSVFYSSPHAFSQPRELYILGLNPGGDPTDPSYARVGRHVADWSKMIGPYSSYLDECWAGEKPGQHGMQPRMKHLFERIGVDLQSTPASNVVFVRSRNEADLYGRKADLLASCWPIHQTVIDSLGIRTILCLGRTAGDWTREMLNADIEIDCFEETNNRRWKSRAYQAEDGRVVVSLTHPSRVAWNTPAADPSEMVTRVIRRSF